MPSTRLTVRLVQSLQQGQVVWDTGVIGLGARRQTGPVSYVLRYRTQDGRQRTYTIGKHGSPWTPESARAEALRLLGEIVQGRDPSGDKEARRGALTIGDLCDQYLADVESGRLLTRRRMPKSASTVLSDRGRIDGHIRPLLGRLSVSALTRQDIEQFMVAVAEGKTRRRAKLDKAHALSNVRGGRGVASRAVSLLGAMLTYAIQRSMRSDNPVRGVLRYADGRRDRRLADTEYGQLARGLSAAEDLEDWPPALAAIRFLLLTGWRSGEDRTLRWADVDAGRRTVRLAATKTGASMRVLSQAAMTILQAMPRGEYVFPAPGGDIPMSSFARVWKRMVHRHAGYPWT